MNIIENIIDPLKHNKIWRFLLVTCLGLMICTAVRTWIPDAAFYIELLTLAGIGFSLLDYDTGQKETDSSQTQVINIPPGIYEYIAEILWAALYDLEHEGYMHCKRAEDLYSLPERRYSKDEYGIWYFFSVRTKELFDPQACSDIRAFINDRLLRNISPDQNLVQVLKIRQVADRLEIKATTICSKEQLIAFRALLGKEQA